MLKIFFCFIVLKFCWNLKSDDWKYCYFIKIFSQPKCAIKCYCKKLYYEPLPHQWIRQWWSPDRRWYLRRFWDFRFRVDLDQLWRDEPPLIDVSRDVLVAACAVVIEITADSNFLRRLWNRRQNIVLQTLIKMKKLFVSKLYIELGTILDFLLSLWNHLSGQLCHPKGRISSSDSVVNSFTVV